MVCPECGSEHIASGVIELSYIRDKVIVSIIADDTICSDCGYYIVDNERVQYTDMPERDHSQRYYIDFEDELWWVCDSRDDMAWDYYAGLEDAVWIRDVFNQAEPIDKQE